MSRKKRNELTNVYSVYSVSNCGSYHESAKKCGNCHRYRRAPSAKGSAPMIIPFVAAAHPIMGGKAPTMDPTHVLNSVYCFEYVYAIAYNAILPAPNIATISLLPKRSIETPHTPVATPQVLAAFT